MGAGRSGVRDSLNFLARPHRRAANDTHCTKRSSARRDDGSSAPTCNANGADHGEIFDHHFVEFTYANGSKLLSQCRHIPNCWSAVSEHAHGSKGTADISGAKIYDAKGDRIWHYGPGGGGGHQQEHHDLMADLRAGKRPNEAEYGAMSTMTSIFGRMATYAGTMLSWDEAINSNIDLSPAAYSFNAPPPVVPNDHGRYAVAVPGLTKTV